jgi:ATP-dependent Clp protease ATP-binding subunit ClpA
MFEGFTKDARAIVERARAEAQALGHGWIGTEHLVLGGAAAAGLDPEALRAEIARHDLDGDALATIGIDLEAVRDRVESSFGRGALSATRPRTSSTPFTARAKKALQLTLREAVAAGDGEIRPEHVLLGVLSEGEGLGARLLAAHGVTAGRLRGTDTA